MAWEEIDPCRVAGSLSRIFKSPLLLAQCLPPPSYYPNAPRYDQTDSLFSILSKTACGPRKRARKKPAIPTLCQKEKQSVLSLRIDPLLNKMHVTNARSVIVPMLVLVLMRLMRNMLPFEGTPARPPAPVCI